MNLVDYSSSIWSIAPAALALILAIATRKFYFFRVGILVGAFMLAPEFIDGSFI
ncbi:Na+/H+ antiporter [Actinobacillus equuli]|nr:Na+/H+ antiporter [Actinobacillus equuli]